MRRIKALMNLSLALFVLVFLLILWLSLNSFFQIV